ncbi:MAG: hypothetical protein LBQ44_01775 [Treponema sp.]|jgi:hypothetical protein|nr:hypothetical protein [Treponema sp.]
MERIYEFEKKAYRNKVLLINYLLIPILGYCLYRVFFVQKNTLLWLFAIAICIYALVNSLLRKSNPRIIKVNDEEIVFSSFGEKRFEISKLTKFRVKITTPNYQVLVRVEDTEGHQGSFWVVYSLFSDKMDLIAELDYLERKIHPGSLRFRGRDKMGKSRPIPQVPENPPYTEDKEDADGTGGALT